jgi:hypothetical protein
MRTLEQPGPFSTAGTAPVFICLVPVTVPVGPVPSNDVRVSWNLPATMSMVPVALLTPLAF